MTIVNRTRKSKLPEENVKCKEAAFLDKDNPTSVEAWQRSRTIFEEAGITESDFVKNPKYFTEKLKGAGLRPRKKKVLGDITYGEVEQAIWNSGGMISRVAQALKISIYHVQQIFKKHKTLDMEFTEFRETLKDEAELMLVTNMRLGKENSIFFYLKCLAKDRGYVERADAVQNKRGVKMKIVRATGAKKPGKKSSTPKVEGNVLSFKKAEAE